jgi:hypothetical protein
MTSHDLEYYSRRERQERDSADRTDDHGARRIHLEMANRYSAMIREMSAMMPPAQQA